MKISVVIPNYNGEKLLQDNLPRVIAVIQQYAQKHQEMVEIVINDDGSQDNSREILMKYEGKQQKQVKFIVLYNEKNYGFSTAVNRGVKKATGDIVVLLNTDVIPLEGFLEPLISHFEDTSVFAVGCMDKSVESGGVVERGRGIGRWEKGFLMHSLGNFKKTNSLWVSGGSGAFRREIWEKIGGLSEEMNPFYWEDIDISYRALKSGYRLVFEQKSIVSHKHEEGVIKRTVKPAWVRTISYRNQFYFVWLNITDPALVISHIVWLPYHLVTACMRKDLPFLIGMGKAFLHLPVILQRRGINRKFFKKKDAELLLEVSE